MPERDHTKDERVRPVAAKAHRYEKIDCQPRLNVHLLCSGANSRNDVDDSPASKRPALSEGLRRLLDERGEARASPSSQTAVLNHDGHRHVVRLVNLSASGVMIAFNGDLAEGDEVMVQLLDHGPVTGQVRWTREGRVGINFTKPLEE